MLTFWGYSPFGGVGTSRVEREYEGPDERCPACGRYRPLKSFKNAKIHIAGPGSKWPDFLNCHGLSIFHERVVKVMIEEGLTGFLAHPTEIVKIDNKRLAARPAPQYFLLEIYGTVEIDLNEKDGVGGNVCPLCFHNLRVLGRGELGKDRIVPILDTWDGSDFVRTRNWYTLIRYCTRRFVDMAQQNYWTNFRFGESMPGVGMWGDARKSGRISYYDADWFERTAEKVRAKHPDLFCE